jgi:D-alanine-D-alanine ligase-like ATP-grasp enzyme
MQKLAEFRSGKPAFCPDQAIYAEFACGELGLEFDDLDGGSGLLFSVASASTRLHFGAGRCSYFPQNNATASTLATDKHFTNRILEASGVATLGGEYFFLHERHRARRSAGHEREDAYRYLARLGGSAFAKPLLGSRGDFAQAVNEASLTSYLDEVARYYDSIILQPVFSGDEYRVFLLDDETLYSARKYPPFLLGDGRRSVRELLAVHNAALRSRGLSAATMDEAGAPLDEVPEKGGRREIAGRTNLSAGGVMVLEAPPSEAVVGLARRAAHALGLRVAAVDLFTAIDGGAGATRVIEVNANPSIRLLEDSNRPDLILRIWRHTFSAMGLL